MHRDENDEIWELVKGMAEMTIPHAKSRTGGQGLRFLDVTHFEDRFGTFRVMEKIGLEYLYETSKLHWTTLS